ncbi:MAG: tol-pal system YbgF family protein [Candidatus Krumholzibacteriia bacterium]
MVAKKRLRKKDIKQDRLVTMALRTSTFVQAHFTQVITGVVVLVAAIGITLFMAQARRTKTTEATQQLAVAMDQFLLRDYEAASTTFLNIADRHPGQDAGTTSLYFLGECYLSLYRYQDAVDAYDRYLDRSRDSHTFRVAARIGRACAYEGLTQFETAAVQMSELAETMDPKDTRYPDVLFRAGVFWEETGDVQKAVGFYDKVSEVATGPLKSRAAVKLAILR